MNRRSAAPFCLVAMSFVFAVTGIQPAEAQTAADVQASVTKLCNVMSGNQKADGQFVQLYMLLQGDLSDANPVELGIQRGVLAQCPKAYLGFQSRARATNPFAAHPLINGSTQLLGPSTSLLATPAAPHDYAMFCRGGNAIASHQGALLFLKFADPGHPANQGLAPGQCGWWTRSLRAGEPDVIEAKLSTSKVAENGVAQTNAGGTWTFWVSNVNGRYFNTTAIAKGFRQTKPH